MTATTQLDTNTGTSWPLQRYLFLIAGTVTLLGTLLAATVSNWFLIVPAIVGANQLLMVAVGWCPMSRLLAHLGVTQPSCPGVRWPSH